jgi:hypothetical protein
MSAQASPKRFRGALFVNTIFFKEIEKSGMIEPHYTK